MLSQAACGISLEHTALLTAYAPFSFIIFFFDGLVRKLVVNFHFIRPFVPSGTNGHLMLVRAGSFMRDGIKFLPLHADCSGAVVSVVVRRVSSFDLFFVGFNLTDRLMYGVYVNDQFVCIPFNC